MKTESKKSTGKITSAFIVALVMAGAAAIWAVADVSATSSLMSKAFLFFIGAVIVVQIVPGIMLLSAMVKGIASLAGKKTEVTEGTDKK
jgi:ABC-type Na+ efflux pump permease subunit